MLYILQKCRPLRKTVNFTNILLQTISKGLALRCTIPRRATVVAGATEVHGIARRANTASLPLGLQSAGLCITARGLPSVGLSSSHFGRRSLTRSPELSARLMRRCGNDLWSRCAAAEREPQESRTLSLCPLLLRISPFEASLYPRLSRNDPLNHRESS